MMDTNLTQKRDARRKYLLDVLKCLDKGLYSRVITRMITLHNYFYYWERRTEISPNIWTGKLDLNTP